MGNLCTFNSASSHHGYNPVQEATDELLVEALRKGKFEDALYYAKSGADATCDLGSRFFDSNCKKPLDYLVKNGRDNNETYRNDVFTPQQRVRIFRELVKNIENPLDLVSDKTLDNALAWGRAEIIPELKAIGVKIESRHFVEAANPIHRRNNALKTMKAMLPYVKDVNVTDPFTGENAGHVVAGKLDLEAFQWLEKKGLKKDAFAKKIWPSTYAHKAATSDIFDKKEEEKRIEFASYLVEKGYPIDTPGRDNRTPTEDAINQRHVGAALVYLNAGTEVKPEYLSRAIIATHFGRTTTTAKDIIAIGEKLAEKNKMNEDTILPVYKELLHIIAMNDKNMKQAVSIAAYLSSKGMTPLEAMKKLQDKDAPESGIVSSDHGFITNTCNQLEQAIKRNKASKVAHTTAIQIRL